MAKEYHQKEVVHIAQLTILIDLIFTSSNNYCTQTFLKEYKFRVKAALKKRHITNDLTDSDFHILEINLVLKEFNL